MVYPLYHCSGIFKVAKHSPWTPIPVARITPGLLYRFILWDGPRHLDKQRNASSLPPVKKYSGLLTAGARKRLMKAISLLVAISLPKRISDSRLSKPFSFRVNFITLTLPAAQGKVTDQELKLKCLKPWLEYWKRKLPGISYVWRAERQKNGNLHFHILSDRFIFYMDMRETWNKQLAKFHFIDAFERKFKYRQPPTEQVVSVRKIRDLAAYIAKYMSKDTPENQPTPGRCWDCSANLKTKDRCEFILDNDSDYAFNRLVKLHPEKVFDSDFFQGIRMTPKEMKLYLPPSWWENYKKYLASVRAMT